MKDVVRRIVVYKDGGFMFFKENEPTWEFENDPDWLVTIDVLE